MAENRSFTRYVTDRFYNNFYSAVEAYIGENPDRLDLNIRNVRTVGGVALADMEIKFVSISDLPEMEIEFDVIVEGEIVVGEGDYHYDDFDQYAKGTFRLPHYLSLKMLRFFPMVRMTF